MPSVILQPLTADLVTRGLVDDLTSLLGDLVRAGAALGWVEPPAATP